MSKNQKPRVQRRKILQREGMVWCRISHEIYHDRTNIADAEGHLCTADGPQEAEAILKALNSLARIEELEAEVAIWKERAKHQYQANVELIGKIGEKANG